MNNTAVKEISSDIIMASIMYISSSLGITSVATFQERNKAQHLVNPFMRLRSANCRLSANRIDFYQPCKHFGDTTAAEQLLDAASLAQLLWQQKAINFRSTYVGKIENTTVTATLLRHSSRQRKEKPRFITQFAQWAFPRHGNHRFRPRLPVVPNRSVILPLHTAARCDIHKISQNPASNQCASPACLLVPTGGGGKRVG